MMLIAMAVYDTEHNNRTWMTEKTLLSLRDTVDFGNFGESASSANYGKHMLIISDNGSCEDTHAVYAKMRHELPFVLIQNDENLGTAKAINRAWRLRQLGEHCIKMDNDVVIHNPGWVDRMEEVFERDDTIGICGLKRKDLAEAPWADGDMKSTLHMLPHVAGQTWLVVEEVRHVMGTCQAYSSALLDRIGYLVQPGVYGFDDSLSAVRARVAGFRSVFLHGVEIDHSRRCLRRRRV
jgi:GT2 family glycosyltransferase